MMGTTLWTGSKSQNQSTSRDLEARERLRDFDCFYTAIGIPKRYVFDIPSKARTALTESSVGVCLNHPSRKSKSQLVSGQLQ